MAKIKVASGYFLEVPWKKFIMIFKINSKYAIKIFNFPEKMSAFPQNIYRSFIIVTFEKKKFRLLERAFFYFFLSRNFFNNL